MSAKTGDDDDENEVFVEDEYLEDDDDDEEDDFHPGGDDDDDDDEEYDDEEDDNEDDTDVSYLDGALTYDVEGQKIHYKGHGFHLESDPVTLNILDKACKPPSDNKLTTTMIGPCDTITAESSGRKPTPRKIKVTFMIAEPNGEGILLKKMKGDEEDNDEGEKKPSVYYQVYGSEIDNPEHGIEFKGGFAPIFGGGTTEIRLLCQVRMSNPTSKQTSLATTATTTNTTTAAVAVGKGRNYENDDNIDDVDEDGIDHNELIALHEEAQLSTEALKKRYRGPSIDDTNGDGNNDEQLLKTKMYAGNSKKKYKSNDDEDDDDDIEF
jgi:hypothetical protein